MSYTLGLMFKNSPNYGDFLFFWVSNFKGGLIMKSFFKKSVELNNHIDEYLNIISISSLEFEKFINLYLEDKSEEAHEKVKHIDRLESEADHLQKLIKSNLYKYMLIPDARADVLSLVKNLDNICDLYEEIAIEMSIEKPHLKQSIHPLIIDIVKNTTMCVDELLNAMKSYFNEIHLVNKYINKVNYHEHEIDLYERKILSIIFNGEKYTHLYEKMYTKQYIKKIVNISDEAEYISEKLTIASIKREF